MMRKIPEISILSAVIVVSLISVSFTADNSIYYNRTKGNKSNRTFLERLKDEINSMDIYFKGEAKYSYFCYQTKSEYTLNDRREIDFNPELKWYLNKKLFLLINGNIRYDFDSTSRSRVVPSELNFTYTGEAVDVILGKQFITWGRADSYKAVDVFKRHDLTDPVENIEETLWALKLGFSFKESNIEFVLIPFFEEDEMPDNSDSRWFFLPRTKNIPGVGDVNLSYSYDYSKLPPKDLSSSSFGVRYNGRNEGLDYSFTYAFSYDRAPVQYLNSIMSFNPVLKSSEVKILPVYNRINVLGIDCATVIAGIGLKSEIAKVMPEASADLDSSMTLSYYRFNLGLDKDFGSVFANINLFIIVQYLYDSGYSAGDLSLRHIFRHALAGKIELKLSEWVILDLKSFNNLEYFDSLLQPEITWKGIENISIVLGADILQGNETGLFGRFKDNTRIRLEAKIYF
ncbi:MAG: hypothetical protein A2452_03640 [Candidatus Firestonebacteria bacterium RIFOXYC2_FULL_39_67]|nr:MAG: hypothetical protein A2452_03640 [Candidatus Firestonebacteria bacterium RIFOXYC2_FULL_39_67]